MSLLFALVLIGLPLFAAYIDLIQTQGETKFMGWDLPSTGGWTPNWGNRTPVSRPYADTGAQGATAASPASAPSAAELPPVIVTPPPTAPIQGEDSPPAATAQEPPAI